METSTRVSELMWSSNSTTNSIQHDYPIVSGSYVDEADMMFQLLTSYAISDEQTLSSWPYEPEAVNMAEGQESLNSSVYFCSDSANSSMYYWPRHASAHEYEMYSNGSKDYNYYTGSVQSRASQYLHTGQQNQWGPAECGNEMGSNDDSEDLHATRSFDAFHLSDQNAFPKRKPQLDDSSSSLLANSFDNPKKKTRASNYVPGGRSTHAKSQKVKTDEVDDTVGLNLQTTSSNTSEDETIVSQEQNGTTSSSILNLNGKTKAGRGSATDPQSLYARKRRERINERLRILQNLVPNGTKVDISTMLEEAVQYVKFLQLQIKLLSSDDLWMYAPIAYNGMDIGLDLKIAQP